MKTFLHSAKFLAMDMASTIFFVGLYALTKNISLAVVAGVALGIGQIAFERARRRPIDTMQWMSLFLVVATGAASLITQSPKFIMLKPSMIYLIVGVVMLRPGWMNRYLPAAAVQLTPDLGYAFGFVWAALMFVSAALNIILAWKMSFIAWGAFMTAYGLATKMLLFLIQYAVMRWVGGRRYRSREADSGHAAQPA